MTKLMDAAVRLYHKREKEQIDRFFNAFGAYTVEQRWLDIMEFENTHCDKIWSWAIKRWRGFPNREYEIRTEGEQE